MFLIRKVKHFIEVFSEVKVAYVEVFGGAYNFVKNVLKVLFKIFLISPLMSVAANYRFWRYLRTGKSVRVYHYTLAIKSNSQNKNINISSQYNNFVECVAKRKFAHNFVADAYVFKHTITSDNFVLLPNNFSLNGLRGLNFKNKLKSAALNFKPSLCNVYYQKDSDVQILRLSVLIEIIPFKNKFMISVSEPMKKCLEAGGWKVLAQFNTDKVLSPYWSDFILESYIELDSDGHFTFTSVN